MNEIKLAEGVYWVGAIDWNIRFCGSYSTPRGTTYNAYLIIDEKVALVDVVKHGFSDEMLTRIKDIIDPKKIDYVISNHAEMDHSGSLPDVMKEATKARVIATEKGKEGLLKHHKISCDFITVKTGDELNLGKKNLLFISAPMLHWPDSMFTYIKEDRILLPNDAFGQHIATPQRFEDEVGDMVMNAAARYYATIVMPYAPLVLKKIQEIKDMGIMIEMIAPAHGTIWRKSPERIIQAYADWAEGKAKDKVLIIYDTMWESTDKMAKEILNGISSEGVEVRLFHLRKSDWSDIIEEVLDAKAILVGSPTLNNGMFPTVAGFLSFLKGLRPKGKIGAAFGSYGWGGGAVRAINEELKKAGFDVIEPGLEIKYVPNDNEIRECFELGKKVARKVKGH
ncbi:MAG: FprA family A-type flavoprotein [Euryarchaeota archaeon]|nr:FprA family A-type flavoprotein [Euryarchaeota archaeon]